MREPARSAQERVCLGLAIALCAAFAVYGSLRAATLEHYFDEGVYIQQARLVLDGQTPYLDFFYHQTPLYLYTLAAFALPGPDSIPAFRLPSVLATAFGGLLVFLMGRRLLSPVGALLASIVFYSAPLQYYGMLALPNAPMMVLATAGLYLAAFRTGPGAAALGAALLVLSVLQKPLALPIGFAAALALLLGRRWVDLGAAAAAGLAAAAASWGFFHVVSDGAFTELLQLQFGRFSSQGGFEYMSDYPPFAKVVADKQLQSAFDWNVNEHVRAMLVPGPSGNLQVVLLALVGQAIVWRRPRDWRGMRAVMTAAWLLPLLFSLFVWEPCWDHYFLQYLPALALLAAVPMDRLWTATRWRHAASLMVLVLLAPCVWSGLTYLESRRGDFERVPRAREGEAWLTFEPFLNFVSGSEPACGLIDPFNVLGERSLVALSSTPAWDRYYVTEADLIRCLEEDPEARVAIGSIRRFFVDDELQAALDALGPQRRVPMPLHFQRRDRSWLLRIFD